MSKTTIKQAINGFLLNCKVEGKSWGTIDCYADKLKGFLWYTTNYDWSDDISEISTQHLREFLVVGSNPPAATFFSYKFGAFRIRFEFCLTILISYTSLIYSMESMCQRPR